MVKIVNFTGRIEQIKKSPAGRHGTLFEKLAKETFAGEFDLIEEWPEYAKKHAKYTVQDIGIDLVAYDSSGIRHAIQCKYRGEKSSPLKKSDIDSFLSACRIHRIEKAILAYVGPNLKPNVREVCRGIEVYGRKRLARLYNRSHANGGKWNFPPTGGVSAYGFNQAGIELFGGRQNRQRQTLPKSIIKSAVRELLQNSLDAKVCNSICKVVFEHDKIDPEQIAAADLGMHMKACEEQDDHPEFFGDACKALRSDQIDVIRVTDSNTIGLDDRRWNMCTVTEGRSVKESETAGGSFGLGKNAPFAMSGIGVVCYATRLPHGSTMGNGDRANRRAIAKCRAISHQLSGKMLQHVGELKSYEQDLVRPGTSITVVGTRHITSKKSWRQEFEDAVKHNFFIAIANGELECDVAGARVKIGDLDETALDGRQRRTPSYLEAVRMYRGGGKRVLRSGDMSFDVWIAASAHDDSLYSNHSMYVNRKGMLITNETSTRRNPFHTARQSHGSFLVLVKSSDDSTEKQMRAMEPPSHAEIDVSRSPECKQVLQEVRKQIEECIRDILFADSDKDDVTELTNLADILPIKRQDSGNQTDLDAFAGKPRKRRAVVKAIVVDGMGRPIEGGGGVAVMQMVPPRSMTKGR